MKYNPATHSVTFELEHCVTCNGTGVSPTIRFNCATCRGTGQGPRGGRGGCRKCYGSGHDYRPNDDPSVLCGSCDGRGTRGMENRYSYLPRGSATEIAAGFTLHVLRSGRANTWNEEHLGLNCVVSVTDYGRVAAMTDDDVVAKVRSELGSGQVLKFVSSPTPSRVVDENGEWLYDETECFLDRDLAVVVNSNGYSVRTVEKIPTPRLTAEQQQMLGMQVFTSGGNGTMAAAMEL